MGVPFWRTASVLCTGLMPWHDSVLSLHVAFTYIFEPALSLSLLQHLQAVA